MQHVIIIETVLLKNYKIKVKTARSLKERDPKPIFAQHTLNNGLG